MIKYKLICHDCQTSFDSWFSSSKEYDKLKKKKFLTCHNCNSLKIEKTLMTPNVFRLRNNTKIDANDKKFKDIKEITSKYQKFIKKNLNNVGEDFAYEARLIHYKEKKFSKGIYGSATEDDLKQLKEEGIKTQTINWIKNETN